MVSTSRPSAAPTNQGAASAAVERTVLKPKVCLTERANGESKIRSTTGTSRQRGPSWSLTARPVSRLARSSLVSTATADAGGKPGGGQDLGQGRVGDHHRDVVRADLAQVPVVLVFLDHHDLSAGLVQLARTTRRPMVPRPMTST